MEKDLRLAVLIDAENFSSKYVKQLFDEIAEDGHASIRRVYGGWTAPQLRPWKKVLETYSISTKQECCYSSGKSASDSAMIIDAMDILYSDAVDGFCIASSDGDFTNLARRIREGGKMILGAGENKTPKAFVNSCNKFIYVDILDAGISQESEVDSIIYAPQLASNAMVEDIAETENADGSEAIGPTPIETIKRELIRYFDNKASKGFERRAYLGTIGNHLSKKYPEFDCRNYHCHSLVQLFKTFHEFEIEEMPSENNSKVKAVYVTCKASDVD